LSARTLVFLPTYNERENIRSLIEEILSVVPGARVLVVDDLSPDGTGELVEEMAKYEDRIEIIHRDGPRGRGYAGIEGLRRAGTREDIDFVVEMDADGSHNPKEMPALIDAAQSADLVLGSRYVQGGGVEGWGWFRTLNSAVANRVARILLGLPYRDATSGYRCFRREVLAALPWDVMISNNPSIVEEILYHVHRRGFRVIEVPIRFIDRTEGESKFSVKLVGRWIANLWRVRRRSQPPAEAGNEGRNA